MDAPPVPRLVVAVLLTAAVVVPPRAAATDAGGDGAPTRPEVGLPVPCETNGGVFGL